MKFGTSWSGQNGKKKCRHSVKQSYRFPSPAGVWYQAKPVNIFDLSTAFVVVKVICLICQNLETFWDFCWEMGFLKSITNKKGLFYPPPRKILVFWKILVVIWFHTVTQNPSCGWWMFFVRSWRRTWGRRTWGRPSDGRGVWTFTRIRRWAGSPTPTFKSVGKPDVV